MSAGPDLYIDISEVFVGLNGVLRKFQQFFSYIIAFSSYWGTKPEYPDSYTYALERFG